MNKESDDKARALKNWNTLKYASPKNKKIIKSILKEEMILKKVHKKEHDDAVKVARKKTKKVKSPHV
jgi:hypothetical protein